MTKPIIDTRNLGKKYIVPSSRVNRRKNGSKFLTKLALDIFDRQELWALRHVDLQIERGEVVAVMGGNGSGKSTLFRLLSEITDPSEGEIILRGRVSSMIEVGVGFHADLNGKENLYLNGALLGMNRREIDGKFDEIIAFSGIEDHLNTPLRKYSKGMGARLAFAIASHLRSDILIVDEVLSVSDQDFRLKSINRLRQLANNGVTILIVSHDTQLLDELCSTAIYLEYGTLMAHGRYHDILNTYLKRNNTPKTDQHTEQPT